MQCTRLVLVVLCYELEVLKRADEWDGREEGHNNICIDCRIDYPNFTRFCLRCGKKLC